MSDLAQYNRQIMSETTSFLLVCLRAGMETANRVLCESRPLDDGERQRIRGAFMAAGLAIDALEAEGKRERLGLAAAISPEVLGNLEQHARAFANYGQALEEQRELYVLDFYRRLRDRLTQYFVRGMRPRKHRKLRQPAIELSGPHFRLRSEPDAQRCYETLARKNGQYEQARKEAKEQAKAMAKAQAEGQQAETEPATEPEKPRMQCGGRGKAATNEARTKPDAIWQHPQLRHIADDYSKAFQTWHEKGAKGPPPNPPRKLRRYLKQNASKNPAFIQLLETINSQGP